MSALLTCQLLERDPEKRLGAGTNELEEIQSHPFFGGLDWGALAQRKVEPPFVPTLVANDEEDTSNFDSQFTSQGVEDTYMESSEVADAAVVGTGGGASTNGDATGSAAGGGAAGRRFSGFTYQEDAAPMAVAAAAMTVGAGGAGGGAGAH